MDIQFKPIQNGFLGHYRKEFAHKGPPLHYHDAYELYYCIDGQRNYLTQNNIYPLNRDWVTLTRPYVIHGTNGQKYERLLVSFSEDFLSTYFQPTLIEVFHEVFAVDAIPAQIVGKNPRIKELFYLIVKTFDSKNMKMTAIYLGELLFLLYDAIKQIPSETNNSTLSSQMQEILAYVAKNLATVKNIEQVANQFYVSKHHLFHLFKKTGFTFIEFLTKVKLSRALHLLEHTNESVAAISEACGFETPAYFCIVFKKKMNMTPLQYRTWINEQTTGSSPIDAQKNN